MKERTVLALARLTRPRMREKGFLAYRLCRALLSLVFPRDRRAAPVHLVVPYDGGLVQVDTSSALEYSILFRGCHEPEIVRLIHHVVRPGDTCLDIGANVGAHALVLAKRTGPTGRVLAFEPHPAVVERLRGNVALNGWEHVTVVQAAVSDRAGEAAFYGFRPGSSRQGISSLLPDENAVDEMRVSVLDAATLAERYDLERCDFIKIDVEGNDAVVLLGLLPLIERFHPFVIFEYRPEHWSKFESRLEDVLERLGPLGYRFFSILDGSTRPMAGAETPTGGDVLCVPERARLDVP